MISFTKLKILLLDGLELLQCGLMHLVLYCGPSQQEIWVSHIFIHYPIQCYRQGLLHSFQLWSCSCVDNPSYIGKGVIPMRPGHPHAHPSNLMISVWITLFFSSLVIFNGRQSKVIGKGVINNYYFHVQQTRLMTKCQLTVALLWKLPNLLMNCMASTYIITFC